MRTLTDVFTPGAPTLPEGLRTLVVSPERELEPGMTVRAAFTFRNQGGAAASGVRVRFNLPDGLVYLVGSGQLDGTELDDEHGNSPLLARAGADIGEVAPGQERRIDIAYSVAGAIENGSTVELQAAVAAFELAPVGSNVVRLVARSRPALANALTNVAIESRSHEPRPGDEATVTVRIHNAGESSAHDVVVVAPVPEHASYIPNTARVNGREFERDLPAPFDRVHAPVVANVLPASATVTLQYRVRIDDPLPDGARLVARAQIASQETPAVTLEASELAVRSQPDFDDERTAFSIDPPADAAPGTRAAIRLCAYNAGSAAAENVTVTLVLPDGLHFARGSARVDGHPLRERKNAAGSYDLGAIGARQSVEFSAEATVGSPLPDGAALSVQAVLRWDSGERQFERTLTVRAQPHLSARRNAIRRSGGAAVRPADECEAVVMLINDGSARASDALLHLRIDPALDDVRVFDKNARLELVNDSVELGTIEPFASRKLTVRARVRSPFPDRSEIRLGAGLHAQELGEVPLGEAVWRVDSHPAFSSESSALSLVQDDVFRPNQLVDVLVQLRNDGTDAAQNVRLRLYVSPEARLESVDGATRERSTLIFGEVPAGATVQARLGIRLLRSLARAHPVSIDAVISADDMLPVQLPALAIVTTAEPNFAVGTLRSQPEEVADAGDEIEFVLHLRNGGDGPAQRAKVAVDSLDRLIYVPNTTSVNGVAVRDAGALSPLMSERGLLMSDVDPGVEATVRWREVVRNDAEPGDPIVRTARIAYDGDRVDEIRAPELKIRCAPQFANAISGLPFGLDGVEGPALGGPAQRALTGSDFVELPPATPIARGGELAAPALLSLNAANGNGHVETAAAPEAVNVAVAFDRDRLQRALRFLGEARFGTLITHLFAIRAFFPDTAGASSERPLAEMRETLREVLERLFIRMRMPSYVIAPRDLETPAARASLQALLGAVKPEEPAPLAGSIRLHGTCDARELRALRERLEEAPLATALPWSALVRLMPGDGEALQHYRSLCAQALDELADADEIAFIDALQRRKYPIVDAALEVVRAQLANTPA